MLLASAVLLAAASASALKFDSVINKLYLPKPGQLAFVEQAGQRTLLRGSVAVYEDPLVRRACEILYEDLSWFRPAGNLLANRLAKCATAAKDLYGNVRYDAAAGLPSLDGALLTLRGTFDSIDVDRSGSLDVDELLEAAGAEATGPSLAARLCLDADDGCLLSYSFAEFVDVVLVEPAAACVLCDDRAALAVAAPADTSDGWSGRFDRMLTEFRSWESEAEGDGAGWSGRSGEIAAGCFAGSRNEELVEALRLLYCDNVVMRGAGDVIFRMLRPRSRQQA